MIYAYARVSAADQNLTRQIDEFTKFGIPEKRIFRDKKSGKDFDRIAYQRLIRKLKKGDLLVIKSIDRLGRNYQSVIDEWKEITGRIGADILVLDMPLLDTRAKEGDTLVGKFISDIVLQVLSFVAENERANIRARQAEGIAVAKRLGVPFGRPKKEYSDEFTNVVTRYRQKEISLDEALELLQMKRSTFHYNLKKFKIENGLYPPEKLGKFKKLNQL